MKKTKEQSQEEKREWILKAIKTAMEYAIFQHEVDRLKFMYSKYKEDKFFTVAEIKDDLIFIEKILD